MTVRIRRRTNQACRALPPSLSRGKPRKVEIPLTSEISCLTSPFRDSAIDLAAPGDMSPMSW